MSTIFTSDYLNIEQDHNGNLFFINPKSEIEALKPIIKVEEFRRLNYDLQSAYKQTVIDSYQGIAHWMEGASLQDKILRILSIWGDIPYKELQEGLIGAFEVSEADVGVCVGQLAAAGDLFVNQYGWVGLIKD